MRIVRFHSKGDPEVLIVEDLPVPEPAPGEVLVKVEAAGVNYGDVLRRSGAFYPLPTSLPFSPGTEVMGVVEKLGDGVDRSRLGERVVASVREGGYAEYAVGDAEAAYPCDKTLTAAQAIAIMDQGVTAALVLKLAGRIRAGDTVLVPAAAGGVGSIGIQLARIYGAAKVIGLAGSETKRDLVRALGADSAIDYTQDHWSRAVLDATQGVGVDLALEMTGGPVFHETLKAVRHQHGRVVIYGNASDQAVELNPRTLVGRNMSITGFLMAAARPWVAETFAELAGLVVEGRLRPQIGATYNLEDAAVAHRALQSRSSTGAHVLVP